MDSTDAGSINWRTDALPPATRVALNALAKEDWLLDSTWYLAGGTALALYAGHRKSVGLDFFTPDKDIKLEEFLGRFMDNAEWKTTIARERTIYGVFHGAKISFIAYPFFTPNDEGLKYGNVHVLSPKDIVVMKIIAISQRGRKRDFIDLFWYVHNEEPLIDILRRVPDQYATVTHDWHHIIKSLMYFVDAEEDPMPALYFDTTWHKVTTYFQKEVPRVAKEILELS